MYIYQTYRHQFAFWSYKIPLPHSKMYNSFGSVLQGRSWSESGVSKYRFGFNGKEGDDETYGEGNCIAFEARIYDSRIGRFMSIDPKSMEYPWQTPYAYYKNSPICTIDYLGMGDERYKEPQRPKEGSLLDILSTSDNPQPKSRAQERAERKFNKKIVTPLKKLEKELNKDPHNTQDVIRGLVQKKAEELAEKYQSRRWLRMLVDGKRDKSPYNVGGGRQKIHILAYETNVNTIPTIQNNRPADGPITTAITNLIAPAGSIVNISFNDLGVPNSLVVSSVGSTQNIYSTEGFVTNNSLPGAWPSGTWPWTWGPITITSSQAGIIQYQVGNSLPSVADDNWELKISVTTFTLKPMAWKGYLKVYE